MGKSINVKDFIRALKRANRKQVYGRLFALDKKTDEVCGCALGQGLIEYGIVTEDEVRAELQKSGTPAGYKVFDPATNTVEDRNMLVNSAWEVGFSGVLDELNNQLPGFTSQVISSNDSNKLTIPQILSKFWDRWLPNGL